VLAVVAAAKIAGGAVRAVQVAVPATAAAVVGVVALPPSVAVAVTLAAGAVCGLLAVARRPAPAAAPVLEAEPPPAPAEERAPAPESAPPRPRKLRVSEHEWDVEALAELVESRANAHPEQAEEWRAFVDELRGHAVDGVLPAGFDALVRDVYSPILPGDA
jgi:hypothetical protein